MPDPTVLLRAFLLLAVRVPTAERALDLARAKAFGRAPAAGSRP